MSITAISTSRTRFYHELEGLCGEPYTTPREPAPVEKEPAPADGYETFDQVAWDVSAIGSSGGAVLIAGWEPRAAGAGGAGARMPASQLWQNAAFGRGPLPKLPDRAEEAAVTIAWEIGEGKAQRDGAIDALAISQSRPFESTGDSAGDLQQGFTKAEFNRISAKLLRKVKDGAWSQAASAIVNRLSDSPLLLRFAREGSRENKLALAHAALDDATLGSAEKAEILSTLVVGSGRDAVTLDQVLSSADPSSAAKLLADPAGKNLASEVAKKASPATKKSSRRRSSITTTRPGA
ncbi:MAG: hypothetical protein HYV63_08850 [Candidatus Schekmanbacteria bacterium]|nr:hypothetical protein [Candidatus Schekmanbacteria bacterium]